MKRMLSIGVVCLLVSVVQCYAGGEYSHKIALDSISFEWSVDGDNLNVRLVAKTDSWVGIGFNPSSAMKDANFVLGYVKSGKVSVTDEFGTSRFQHQEDSKIGGETNITDVSGDESGGMTTVSFTIPLNSGDDKDQVISPDADTVILLAHGAGRDSFKSKHSFRSELKVNLSTGAFSNL